MADKLWYFNDGGRQEGPYTEAQLRDLIARTEVTADTLVWCQSMPGWAKAAEVGLMAGTIEPLPVTVTRPAGAQADSLIFTGRIWPLFGRSLLIGICQYLVIPAPWANTSYYRWFVHHLSLPNNKPVGFAGKPGDIWYIFILLALSTYGGTIHWAVQLIALPFSVLFWWIILRWFIAKLIWHGRSAPLQFTGSFWGLLGWSLLTGLSFITIIGWAWALTATLRWMCRHVEGSSKQLIFVASGWSMLWRTLLFSLFCALLIPIPWMLRWYVRWSTAQFHLIARA
jgi:hypothetical protein